MYIDGSWELFVRAGDEVLPNALFEFGEPLPCTEELYAHIGEHGDVVAAAMPLGPFSAISADFALFICRRMC